MPERDAPGQRAGSTQQGAFPGDRAGAPSPGAMPGQEQFGSTPTGGSGGQPQGGYGRPPGGAPGHPSYMTPVNRDETRVVGRRVVQYVIDYVLVGIIPGLAYWLLDRGSLHWVGWFVATIIAIVVYLWYWVLRPHSHTGQTIGMQLLGVRIISKGGGPASMTQLFVRAILLIIDTLFFGLVGLITMMASRYHQRVGDHMAKTLVVAARYGAPSQFADPSSHQMGSDNMGGPAGMSQPGMNQGTMDQGAPGDMR